jgi:hypothetical protein
MGGTGLWADLFLWSLATQSIFFVILEIHLLYDIQIFSAESPNQDTKGQRVLGLHSKRIFLPGLIFCLKQ